MSPSSIPHPILLALLLTLTTALGCLSPDDPSLKGTTQPAPKPEPSASQGPETRTITRDVFMIAGVNSSLNGHGYYAQDYTYWQYFEIPGYRPATVNATMTWEGPRPMDDDLMVELWSIKDGAYVDRAVGESPLEMSFELEPGEYGFYPRQDDSPGYFLLDELHYEITGPIEPTFPE